MTQEETPERRLVLLLCGTHEHRRARSAEATALLREAHTDRLVAILKRLNLIVLIGQRLLALDVGVEPRLRLEFEAHTAAARERGAVHELLTLGVLARLESAGIRALALKGSVLARRLYGDVAFRTTGDIDILVSTEDLSDAIAVVRGMGWHWERQVSRTEGLPVLHETLVHPTVPRVELHWRVHWYEKQFAADALVRAERSGTSEPLRMQPLDGLAALILFYARDGFAGLRMAADVAAWCDATCSGIDVNLSLGSVAERYPALARPLLIGSQLLGSLVAVPSQRFPHAPFRWRVAAELATPFLDVSRAQLEANSSLVDLLLAPPKGGRESLRREGQKAPMRRREPLAGSGALSGRVARLEHLLRIFRRWALALSPAVISAYKRGHGRSPSEGNVP